MDIQAKIVEFYGNVAKEISRRACTDCGFYSSERQICYNNMISSGANIQYLFNEFLNELDRYLMPDKQEVESEISVEDYYNDTSVLSLDKIINDVKKALKSEFQHCNHGADYNKLKSKTYHIISRKINQMYIAQIVYYKQNHRYYDKNLEQAYREIIAAETAQSNSVLSKTTAEKIQRISRQITSSATRDVYNEIYNKKTVDEKYKISYEEMADIVNKSSPILCLTQISCTFAYNKSEYYHQVRQSVTSKNILPFNTFFSSYVKKHVDEIPAHCKNPYKSYQEFIKNKLGIVVFLNYRKEKTKFNAIHEIKVCSSIAAKFGEYAVKTRLLFKNKKVRACSHKDCVKNHG